MKNILNSRPYMKILITGIAGTGKSTIAKALNGKGIEAVDLHDVPGVFFWQDKKTGVAIEYAPVHSKDWFDTVDRLCDIKKVKEMFEQNPAVVMVGSTSGSNQNEFFSLFDKIILLQSNPDTLVHRMQTEDADRLSEIERTREELLRSGNLPEEVKEMLRQMDVKGKSKEVHTFIENQGKERETIAPAEEGEEVRIGRETTPVFESEQEKLSWDISTNQFRENGQTMVELSFKRNDGVEIQPGGAPAEGKVRFEDRDRYIPLGGFVSVGYFDADGLGVGGDGRGGSNSNLGVCPAR